MELLASKVVILNIIDLPDNCFEARKEIDSVVSDLEKYFDGQFWHLRMIQHYVDQENEQDRPRQDPLPDFIKIYEVDMKGPMVLAIRRSR